MVKMIETTINGKWKIKLPEHRALRPEWSTEQGWEKKRLEHMHKTLTKDDIVFYVGSEEADMPALIQMWGSNVVLFEPNPKVWSNAKAIWQANKLENPITFQGFCSNDTQIIDPNNALQVGFPQCADDEIIAAHGFKELRTESQMYNQIKIDDITEYTPTVISIDVEGAEGHVLRGAEQTLRKHHPKIYLSLHSEFLITQYNEWAAELRAWLVELGYKEELIDYPLHETHLFYS